MRATVIGAAAGGGVPQWNCGCDNCLAARRGDGTVAARTQDSVAIETPGGVVLLNASPDVLRQIDANPWLQARSRRDTPLAAIVLTNGDLDHVLGLFSLRESSPLVIYATARVRHGLEQSLFIKTLQRFPEHLTWRTLEVSGEQDLLGPGGVPLGARISAFSVPGKLPVHLMTGGLDGSPEDNVGVAVSSGGRSLAYVTTAGGPGDYLSRLADVDALLFDGTFWSEDEMPAQGLSKSRARDMAHWPVGGETGSLAALADKAPAIRIYTHLNNTNPMLREGSPERATVRQAGFQIAEDGTSVFP